MNGNNNEKTWIVGIDAGGTFTDAVAYSNEGQLLVSKVDSTPKDPSQGLMDTVADLERQGVNLQNIQLFGHGTTVATNAMITGKIAETMLITTAGFKDIMGYRQSIRPSLYSLTPTRPAEIVKRANSIEVDERLDSAGKVITALNETEIQKVLDSVKEKQPQAIAISFLFSYLNDEHEKQLAKRINEAFPEIPVTISSSVAREFREYPRTATTVINAALRPVVAGYLSNAKNKLKEKNIASPVVVMQSNGGSVSIDDAAAQAHKLLLSGPAGGVAGLLELAKQHGLENLISFDMGGTSLDICLVRDNTIPISPLQVVRDHTLISPSVDIHAIGAGGGSIAWLDESNRLRVGPQSAGANPGPAAYGRGGTEATITDAHVVLGTLGTDDLAGGLTLDKDKAKKAIAPLAEKLGMTVIETANAIIAVSLAQMIRAVRKVSIEKGLDPRKFVMVPFGGAGPLHASLILRHMKLESVIVPAQPGVFAAKGLLSAGLRMDRAQTFLVKYAPENGEKIYAWLQEAQEEMHKELQNESVQKDSINTESFLDCRYYGQGYEVSVPIENITEVGIKEAVSNFHDAHKELYGHSDEAQDVEIVTVRTSASGKLLENVTPKETNKANVSPDKAVIEEREIFFPGTDGAVLTKVYDKNKLEYGNEIAGPAVIFQMDSTTVILPEQKAQVLATGDIIIKDLKND